MYQKSHFVTLGPYFFQREFEAPKNLFLGNISRNMHFMTKTLITKTVPDKISYGMVYLHFSIALTVSPQKPRKMSQFPENVYIMIHKKYIVMYMARDVSL